MKKAAVVYWSGTGNTEAMAVAVVNGIRSAGAQGDLFAVTDFSSKMAEQYDAIAFGCPAMGAEELEADEFEPVFSSCEEALSGKPIALFGSYGWGDGEWMSSWAEHCREIGAVLVCESVICCEAPDESTLAACNAMGKALI